MPNILDGNHGSVEGRFAIVVSRYNDSITGKLVDGAIETLLLHGVDDTSIDVIWVPGAYEIPLAADHLAAAKRYRAVICLGAVIRGETTHDQHINRAVSLAIMDSSIRYRIPITFGILTCNTLEQAIHRSGGNVGNKGVECAQAAIEMVRLLPKLEKTD
jgi:6,7-dimethyl-8-ribityllumazine synthase